MLRKNLYWQKIKKDMSTLLYYSSFCLFITTKWSLEKKNPPSSIYRYDTKSRIIKFVFDLLVFGKTVTCRFCTVCVNNSPSFNVQKKNEKSFIIFVRYKGCKKFKCYARKSTNIFYVIRVLQFHLSKHIGMIHVGLHCL